MAKESPEPVAARMKGLRLVHMLDTEFVGRLEKEIPGIRHSHLYMRIPKDSEGKKFEGVVLGHKSKEHEGEGILTVDCDEPETLQKFVRVLGSIREEAHD